METAKINTTLRFLENGGGGAGGEFCVASGMFISPVNTGVVAELTPFQYIQYVCA
jgi:hypothetical protein